MCKKDFPFDSDIEKLKSQFKWNFSKKNVQLYDEIYRDVFSQKEISAEKKQLKAFRMFLENKELLLTKDDIFAGQIQHYLMRYSQPMPADGNPESFDPAIIRTGAVNSPENAAATVKICFENGLSEREQKIISYLESGVACGYFTHYPIGHAITGFPKVIQTGFAGLKSQIKKNLINENISKAQLETGNVMLETIEACQRYFKRYQDQAEILAQKTTDKKVKKRLCRIARALKNITENPASDFFEALQFIVLLQELILTQVKGSMSLGRIDVLLYPYYQQDCENKRENNASAQTLIDAAMIKLAGCIGGYQNVTLGGCNQNGDYAGNEISLMILRSSRRLGYDQPLLSFRMSDTVPKEHWEEILKTIEKGGGFPALFWDDVIINSRTRLGVPLVEARDYGIVGCVEPSICGKEFSNTEALRINWCKTLELMLNNGICPVTGEKLFLKTKRKLEEIKDFEEFLCWYREELEFATEIGAYICNIVDRRFCQYFPSTLLTITLEGGIERLDDCGHLGCTYTNSCINHTGIANAVDSLMAIKKIVFDSKKVSLLQLKDILDKNFSGEEELQKFIQKNCPKFGNGDPETNHMAAMLVNAIATKTESIRNERNGRFLAGYYSVYHHAAMGRLTGALPDGRKKGESLANGLSPAQGADKEGPTAVICAMKEFDQKKFANGMVLDLKFNPSFFRNPQHRAKFKGILDVYFQNGGMEMQINVIDRETLLDAKKYPEKHENLLVRVSGFSAYFVNLFEELQDEIIKRTEYM